MIQYVDNCSFKKSLSIIEQYIGESVIIEPLAGGLVNRFSNEEDSIFRLKTSQKNYFFKTNNSNQNIKKYFEDAFAKVDIKCNITDVLNLYSLLPGIKESKIYDFFSSIKIDCIPSVYLILVDSTNEKSYILMEDLSTYFFYDYLENICPSYSELILAVETLATIHNLFYEQKTYEEINELHILSSIKFDDNIQYFKDAIKYISNSEYGFFTTQWGNIFDEVANAFKVIDKNEKILSQNDFSLRNTCFDSTHNLVKVFDWDLCCIQNPEFDLVEYLIFLPIPLEKERFYNLINIYREKSIRYKNFKNFMDCFRANIFWFIAYKWNIFSMLGGLDKKIIARMAKNISIYLSYI